MGTGTGAGTGRGLGRGCRPVDEHRMRMETGTGTEARTAAEMGTGTRITRMGTRIESRRAEEREGSARNRKIVLDSMWETGETWVERGKSRKERVGPVAANPDNLESNKEAGGGGTRY